MIEVKFSRKNINYSPEPTFHSEEERVKKEEELESQYDWDCDPCFDSE